MNRNELIMRSQAAVNDAWERYQQAEQEHKELLERIETENTDSTDSPRIVIDPLYLGLKYETLRCRVIGGTLAPEWESRGRSVDPWYDKSLSIVSTEPWCDVSVMPDGFVGLYGGGVQPGAWPELFKRTEVSEVSPAGTVKAPSFYVATAEFWRLVGIADGHSRAVAYRRTDLCDDADGYRGCTGSALLAIVEHALAKDPAVTAARIREIIDEATEDYAAETREQ